MNEGNIEFFKKPLEQKLIKPKKEKSEESVYEIFKEREAREGKKELKSLPELYKYGEMTIAQVKSEKEEFEEFAKHLIDEIGDDEYDFRKQMMEAVSEEIKSNLSKFIMVCDEAEEKIKDVLLKEKLRSEQGLEITKQELEESRKKIDEFYGEYLKKSAELKKEQKEIIAKIEKEKVQEVKKEISEK